MARAPEAQPVVGGTIDPLAQQSLIAGRQGAENRLVTAMQQAGETHRANIQSATQLGTAGIQAGAQQNIAAMQKQVEEAAGARTILENDRQRVFDEKLVGIKATLDAKQKTVDFNRARAVAEGDLAREKETTKQNHELEMFKIHNEMAESAANLAGILSIADSQMTDKQKEATFTVESTKLNERVKAAEEMNSTRGAEIKTKIETFFADKDPLKVTEDDVSQFANGLLRDYGVTEISWRDLIQGDPSDLAGKLTGSKFQAVATVRDALSVYFGDKIEHTPKGEDKVSTYGPVSGPFGYIGALAEAATTKGAKVGWTLEKRLPEVKVTIPSKEKKAYAFHLASMRPLDSIKTTLSRMEEKNPELKNAEADRMGRTMSRLDSYLQDAYGPKDMEARKKAAMDIYVDLSTPKGKWSPELTELQWDYHNMVRKLTGAEPLAEGAEPLAEGAGIEYPSAGQIGGQ